MQAEALQERCILSSNTWSSILLLKNNKNSITYALNLSKKVIWIKRNSQMVESVTRYEKSANKVFLLELAESLPMWVPKSAMNSVRDSFRSLRVRLSLSACHSFHTVGGGKSQITVFLTGGNYQKFIVRE